VQFGELSVRVITLLAAKDNTKVSHFDADLDANPDLLQEQLGSCQVHGSILGIHAATSPFLRPGNPSIFLVNCFRQWKMHQDLYSADASDALRYAWRMAKIFATLA